MAIELTTDNKPINKIRSPFSKECINKAAPVAVTKTEKAVTKGHGLGSTKWYGCFWIVLILYNLKKEL
jgi:hypothetical protein